VDPNRTVAAESLADVSSATPPSESARTQVMDTAVEPERPVVPGYQILEVLGRGGMGVVYKARQVGLNRLVALKMVLAGVHAAPQDLIRFLAEAEVVARLQHTNIVQIYQIGRHGDVPYFSLEYIDGGSLGHRLAGVPQQPRAAAALIESLARAMHVAHRKGIVHRDLKPGNILLRSKSEIRNPKPDGANNAPPGPTFRVSDYEPKITDFGLAKHVDTGSGLTQTGAILGTPSYMAPEQAEAKKDVGPAVDIYALGAILYEMLTGRPPFRGPTPLDTVMHVLSDEPVAPTRLQPGVPRDLETVCLKCLHKEPGKRYATAEALADDLQRFLTDRPIVARRTGALERVRRWCRRNPVVAGMSAAVVILLFVLAVGASVAAVLLGQQRNDARASLGRAETAERERTEQLATSYLEQARARRYSRQPGQHFQSLDALAEAARIVRGMNLTDEERDRRLDELRTEAIACLPLTDLRRERRLQDVFIETHGTGYQRAVAFTPDWDVYARAEPEGPISVRKLADDTEIIRLSHEGAAAYILFFSADGRYLAAKYFLKDRPADYIVWDWLNGTKAVRQACRVDGRPTVDFAFTPDSRYVLLGCRADGSLGVYDLATGQEAYRVDADGQPPWVIAPSSDGRRVATGLGKVVAIRDLQTGQALGEPWRLPEDIWALTWQQGSDLLAAGAGNRIYLWDAATRQSRGVLEGQESNVVKLAFNPAGTLLASFGWDNTTRLWDPAGGKELLQITGDMLEFSPDGRHMAYVAGKELGIWEVADGGVCRILAHPGNLMKSDFNADGRLLLAATDAGCYLWDVLGGKQLATLEDIRTESALFLPSGDILTSPYNRGVNRWRVRPAEQGAIHVGPPLPLPVPTTGRIGGAALDAGGRQLAVVDFRRRLLVLDLDGAAAPFVVTSHPLIGYAAMSPDGRWVATSTFKGVDVKVWDLASRTADAPAVTFRAGDRADIHFSRDGRWLVMDEPVEDVRYFYRVGSWETARQETITITAGVASAADGTMAAADQGGRAVKIFDPETGRIWATLPAPQGQHVAAVSMTRDGTRLSALSGRFLQVWDLRALRADLAKIDLDWQKAPYPSPTPGARPGPPDTQTVTVEKTPGALPPAAQPGVVVVPSIPKPRPATPEEIAAWVRRLDDADPKARQAAADALAEVGAPAVEALNAADGPRRKPARAVLDRIAVAEALAPTRLRLTLEDALPADAIKTLAERSHLAIDYKAPPDGTPQKRIKLDLEDVTAWEALDRICEAGDLGYTILSTYSVQVSQSAPRPSAVRAYMGPFRLQLAAGSYQRTLASLARTPQTFETLQLQLALLKEPQARLLSVRGAVRLTEASDPDGRSLLPAFQPGGIPQPVQEEARTFLVAPLKPPERRTEQLKVLKGVMSVEVMARSQELVVVPNLDRAARLTFRGELGHRLTVTSAQSNGRQWTVQLRLVGPPGWQYDPKQCAAELLDKRGRVARLSFGSLSPTPLRGLQPEDMAWTAADPLAPGLAALPWPALALQGSRRDWREWNGSLQFLAPAQFEGPVTLRLRQFDRLQAELPFELHDVPLP
jgi:WD40 repeat protein